MSEILKKYIPEDSIPLITKWFQDYNFHLRISKKRETKLGDFRPNLKGKLHNISVNGDLNKYHFLITLTHEIAHAAVWDRYQNKVAPHGKEWKSAYQLLLRMVMNKVEFPKKLELSLQKHLNKPKASSCSDPQLYKVLKQFDTFPKVHLEDLSEGEHFIISRNKRFKKGVKRRTRYECINLDNNRTYLVSGHAEVRRITVNKKLDS